MLTIQRLTDNLVIPFDDCSGVAVPDEHKTTGAAADMIIYVTAGNDDPTSVGWASSCALNSDRIPAAGRLHLESGALDSLSFEDQLATVIHEIAHLIAFNPSFYTYFQQSPVSSSVTPRGV